jgi:hypothetical protein
VRNVVKKNTDNKSNPRGFSISRPAGVSASVGSGDAPDHSPPSLDGMGVVENDCGFTVAPGDGEALTERIIALAGDRDLAASMRARARMDFERLWHKERALAEWEALLQAVGHPHLA